MTDLYSEWRDFYVKRVGSWMSLEELRAECGKLLTADKTSPELLLIHAMHALEECVHCDEARADKLATALRAAKETMLSQVKWEVCDCGCPQGRKPADAVSVTWLRAVQQVEIATARAEAEPMTRIER